MYFVNKGKYFKQKGDTNTFIFLKDTAISWWIMAYKDNMMKMGISV
jgi:hypothetical protein